ncbi:helix-turn-helix transcriptional regulator [Clostridium sp. AM58-1XD]|uniref:helix-turn-helix domain-containing protein n=1 Tax=Clostridium sp. AM58-1XD TaxID=2292307 RepID=UPI000E4DF4AF|nr:helix-turn-helix transcriptional regulator [Clostridium sp. AM58-1XD]RGZ01869.1 XRE family transcriptional regulator [Clostridium sp. AM58-1XD]
MTLFAKLLKHYIDSSGYTIYQLAKRSGVNRTSIQKALSEDRLPVLESIKELEKYLNLTPEERRQFWAAYEMAFYGEAVFYQRQSVRQLITSLSQSFYENQFRPSPMVSEPMPVSFHSRKLYHSPYEFCQVFRYILENEAKKQENSALSPVLISFSQTPPPFIFDNFASFLSGRHSSRIRIQQIIHFIKNPGNSGKRLII